LIICYIFVLYNLKSIIMNTEKEKILKEISEYKEKIQKLEEREKQLNNDSEDRKAKAIKKLEEYSDEEKIKFFDKLYKTALSELEFLEKNKYNHNDDEHYAWEAYIQILSKDNDAFWSYYNSLEE